MRSHPVLGPSSFHLRVAFSILTVIVTFCPAPAHATFHLTEITKVMVGLNGNNTIQAVEMKMLLAGENLYATAQIRTYDAAGAFTDSLGTFQSNVCVPMTAGMASLDPQLWTRRPRTS